MLSADAVPDFGGLELVLASTASATWIRCFPQATAASIRRFHGRGAIFQGLERLDGAQVRGVFRVERTADR